MISLLYSLLCIIIIIILGLDNVIYPVLILQTILTLALLKEDRYCIEQLKNKLNQSYMLLNDCYGKKKV
jgi:hypothetical protein